MIILQRFVEGGDDDEMKRRVRVGRVLIAVVVGVADGGCSASFPWLARRVGARSPHEDRTSQTASKRSGPARRSPSWDSYQVVRMAFEVVRIQLPMEGIRNSRKIWNHVDTMRLEPGLAERLVRNGLRVGVVSPGAWPAIQTILDACDAAVHKERTPDQNGLPLTIELGVIAGSESIFCYPPSNRLVGKTYQGGKKLITIEYGVHTELGGCVDVQAQLEIRRDRGVMTWERRDGALRQVPAVDRHLFSDLAARATLNPGEALLIGPSASADNEYLLGSRFLMSRQAGGLYETLLCITPIPYQLSDATSR